MSAGDLTTLSSVSQWLKLTNPDSPTTALLQRLIRSASAFVLNYLNRSTLQLVVYNEMYDGYGNTFMVLRNSPVYSIQAVSFNGVPIPQCTGDGFTSPFSDGWDLDPDYSISGSQRLNFYNRRTPRGRGMVAVRYQAGYVVIAEPQTVPSTATGGLFLIPTTHLWLGDVSLTYANGTPLTCVASSPLLGQYTNDVNGNYVFNASDASAPVLITYSFVPPDVEQVACEIVGERFKYLDRIGIVSKSLGGQETVTYSQKSITAFNRELLEQYRMVVPS